MTGSSRRRFLGTVGLLPAGVMPLGIPGARAADRPIGEGWIDSHVHVWTDDFERYPLSPNFDRDDVNPPVFEPSHLLAEQEGAGVTRTVLVQMSFYEFDNAYLLDVIAARPERFRGIAIVDESQPDVAATMKDLATKGVRGFRLYAFPDRVAEWEDSEGIRTMWRTGAEEGLAMCCLTDPESLPVIHRLCERHPETPVVIDHFARLGAGGRADRERLDQLLALAEFPRTFVKTSAFYALSADGAPYTDLAPMFREVRDAFGSERLMWGSDCPYQVQTPHTYGASVDLVAEKLDFLTEKEKRDILRDTADRVFFG